MEAKLSALKVPELKALLTKASLPATGVKADLVARLLGNPAATAELNGAPTAADAEEDLLAYDNDDTAATASAVASAPATSAPATSPAAATAVATSATAEAVAPAKPEPTAEEAKVTLISELEKRLARASRFGEPTEDIQAKLDRARKFGVETEAVVAGMKGLDKGLQSKTRGRDGGKEKPKAIAADAPAKETGAEAKTAPVTQESKNVETADEKATREARQAADEAAKVKRAARFGLPAAASAPSAAEPEEEERKRKRAEKFNGEELAEKKAKA